jgi:hypothetical protein
MRVSKTGLISALISVWLIYGCAASLRGTPGGAGEKGTGGIIDISKGLPAEGLWRQSIELTDMNGDGYLDIVAPPPRKAKDPQKKPHIFLWDSKEGKWVEGDYRFPELKDYDYGGIAAGDLNGDGNTDIVVATHGGRIILLLSDGKGGFIDNPFPIKEEFHSRTIALSDMNGDGKLDIIALSEAPFDQKYTPKGLLIGINKDGREWEPQILEEGRGLFGDSLAVGDITGDRNMDIAAAILSTKKEDRKVIWTGDGKGGFEVSAADGLGETVPFAVRAGDLNGDGRDEVVFLLSGIGLDAKVWIAAFTWNEGGLKELPAPNLTDRPFVFDLFDWDGDGRDDLVVLTRKGLSIQKLGEGGWVELASYPLEESDTAGAYDLRAGRNKDGSRIIVYNLGRDIPAFNQGIRALRLK